MKCYSFIDGSTTKFVLKSYLSSGDMGVSSDLIDRSNTGDNPRCRALEDVKSYLPLDGSTVLVLLSIIDDQKKKSA